MSKLGNILTFRGRLLCFSVTFVAPICSSFGALGDSSSSRLLEVFQAGQSLAEIKLELASKKLVWNEELPTGLFNEWGKNAVTITLPNFSILSSKGTAVLEFNEGRLSAAVFVPDQMWKAISKLLVNPNIEKYESVLEDRSSNSRIWLRELPDSHVSIHWETAGTSLGDLDHKVAPIPARMFRNTYSFQPRASVTSALTSQNIKWTEKTDKLAPVSKDTLGELSTIQVRAVTTFGSNGQAVLYFLSDRLAQVDFIPSDPSSFRKRLANSSAFARLLKGDRLAISAGAMAWLQMKNTKQLVLCWADWRLLQELEKRDSSWSSGLTPKDESKEVPNPATMPSRSSRLQLEKAFPF